MVCVLGSTVQELHHMSHTSAAPLSADHGGRVFAVWRAAWTGHQFAHN